MRVTKDSGWTPSAGLAENVQRAGIQTLSDGVMDQIRRHPKNMRVSGVLQPVALQRAQVIRIPELRAKVFKNLKVTPVGVGPEEPSEMPTEICHNPVIIEQRIVDVKKDDRVVPFHTSKNTIVALFFLDLVIHKTNGFGQLEGAGGAGTSATLAGGRSPDRWRPFLGNGNWDWFQPPPRAWISATAAPKRRPRICTATRWSVNAIVCVTIT